LTTTNPPNHDKKSLDDGGDMGWRELRDSDHKLIDAALNRQNQAQDRLATEICGAFGARAPFCTTRDTIKTINHRMPQSLRKKIMRSHPYWREHKVRTGLAALAAAVQEANLDFTRAELGLCATA